MARPALFSPATGALLAVLLASACAQTFPEVPSPFSTTLLRTHHYADALYLSVGEELSVKTTADGHLWEAYMIAPGWPFDLRDDPTDPTVVLGLRVVYEYVYGADAHYNMWYYSTNTAGEEECLVQGTYDVPAFEPTYKGNETVRGIETEVWVNDDEAAGTQTTYYMTPDLDGELYHFRIHVAFPEGSSEVEWTLDHGTHYGIVMEDWFDTSNCTRQRANSDSVEAAALARAVPHFPRARPLAL